MEYMLGGTIGTNDIGKLPQISSAGGNMSFTFIRDQVSFQLLAATPSPSPCRSMPEGEPSPA